MKAPHLCWVHQPPQTFASLVADARAAGLRVGWLQLGRFAPLPELGPAADAGLARSVAVGGGASVALKPIAGEPVLRDLLREHFLGFRLVLLSGDPRAPQVRLDAGLHPFRLWRARGAGGDLGDAGSPAWKLVSPGGREWSLDQAQLLGRLARPRLGRERPAVPSPPEG